MSKPYEMHVISHSHWDREWRYSFTEYRLQLIDMMDRLLEILDTRPDFKHYHLDAQTSLVEDYLEIRPENRKRIERYVKEGRILIGPWYTLPEEFLISGESLVRNLMLGHKIASDFGKVMKVGYMPTSCGQISQLPQIFSGFGIDTALFYRGINPHDAKSEFIWQGPDGTRALAFHFYGGGRANFFSFAFMPVLNGGWKAPSLEDAKRYVHVMNHNYRHLCDYVDPPSEFHGDMVEPSMKYLKRDALGKATTRYLLYMDGADNGGPHPFTVDFIRNANKLSKNDKFLHGNLPDYVAKVKKVVRGLEVLKGEMRHAGKSPANALYVGVLSSRMYIKQLNIRTEYNLAGRAEPWSVVAWLLGHEYPKSVLDRAWRYLLANHAHDSMEAPSTDPVHDDMEYRFRQCDEMSLGTLRRSLGKIVSKMPLCREKESSLIVFNPMPQPRSEVVSAVAAFPDFDVLTSHRYDSLARIREVPRDPSEDLNVKTIGLYDGDREIPCTITSQTTRNICLERMELNTQAMPAKQFHFNFLAKNIPAMGYKVFRIVPNKPCSTGGPSLVTSKRVMQNEYLRVKINDNGSLTVKDKQTGRTFSGLHVFQDEGETSNWSEHVTPEIDQPINSTKTKAAIRLEHADAFTATYMVMVRMSLPAEATPDKKARSRRKKTLEISSRITLRRGAKRIDIVTTIDNRVKDHRLRMLFPSGINTRFSWAGGQFDVLKRPARGIFKKGWCDSKLTTHPQYHFVDVSDGKLGLGILTEGLTEYEILNDKKRTIAVTMIRAFRDIFGMPARSDDTGAQSQRLIEFKYSICPHAGDYQRANLFAEARRFNLPLEAVQTGRRGGPLGNQISFLSIEPASLILSAMKQSESGKSMIVRFFNPLLKKLQATISCFGNVKQVWQTNLNEERIRELKPRKDGRISIAVKPKKIITLEIMPNREK